MSALGKKPKLVWLPVAKLAVDPKYQRDIGSRRSRNMIAKIAADFRWSRFGVVLTVKNAKGFWVIDGQHRVEACRARGDVPEVPCVILPHKTVAEAAADFVAINRDRVAVTPLHIHWAMLAAGEKLAVDVAQACREAGVSICRYPVPADKMKPGETLAIGAVQQLVKRGGAALAAKVLKNTVQRFGTMPGAIRAPAIREVAEELGARCGHENAPAANTKDAKKRTCLTCGRAFLSEHKGNRMCPRCKPGSGSA